MARVGEAAGKAQAELPSRVWVRVCAEVLLPHSARGERGGGAHVRTLRETRALETFNWLAAIKQVILVDTTNSVNSHPVLSTLLDPSPSAKLPRRRNFALCSASFRPPPPENEDIELPPSEALLGEGEARLCLCSLV